MTFAIALSTQNAHRLLGPGSTDVGPFLESPQIYRRRPANDSGTAAIMFGAFCLLPTQRLLLEADEPVRLGSRALDILIALVERHGELVTKKDLMARVWPGIHRGRGQSRRPCLRPAAGSARRSGRAPLPDQHSRTGLSLCRANLGHRGSAARVVMGSGSRTRFRHARYAFPSDRKHRRGRGGLPHSCSRVRNRSRIWLGSDEWALIRWRWRAEFAAARSAKSL